MTIWIGQHEFDGPFSNLADIPAAPGLYAVLQRENQDVFLVEMDQSNNLARSLAKSAASFQDRMVVLLCCDDRERRKEILHELLREFEFEDEDAVQAAPARRTETKAGVACSL